MRDLYLFLYETGTWRDDFKKTISAVFFDKYFTRKENSSK